MGRFSFLRRGGRDRVEWIRDDSMGFVRSLSSEELLLVVDGAARSGPLSELEVDELLDERYPIVRPEWIPEELW